jgi:hypothetical protein
MIAPRTIATVIGRLTILDWPALVWHSSPPLEQILDGTDGRVEVLASADDPPPFRRNERVLVVMTPTGGSAVVFHAMVLRVASTGGSHAWHLELQLSAEAINLLDRAD